MKKMIMRYAVALVAIASQANALVILNTSSTLLISDPTQLGRMTRNGVASDWSASKAFPGVTNPGVTYNYQVFNE